MSQVATQSRKNILSVDDWETLFSAWSVGPGTTEQNRLENAERMVKEAIRDYQPLKGRNLQVFTQGSYRNRTNVRRESDVDVCVRCMDGFFPDYDHVEGVSSQSLGFGSSTYNFAELKRDVEGALVQKFGREHVKPGTKAFNIQENTYRVSADVVPTFEGRLYYRDVWSSLQYHSGTVLECSATGRRINNWPHQHYDRGVQKHTETGRQFKKKARILKNLRNHMDGVGIASAGPMASFLLESLVHNAPSYVFATSTNYGAMRSVIAWCWDATSSDEKAKELLEVNRIKYLFHYLQGWNRPAVNSFLRDAWDYVGFAGQ